MFQKTLVIRQRDLFEQFKIYMKVTVGQWLSKWTRVRDVQSSNPETSWRSKKIGQPCCIISIYYTTLMNNVIINTYWSYSVWLHFYLLTECFLLAGIRIKFLWLYILVYTINCKNIAFIFTFSLVDLDKYAFSYCFYIETMTKWDSL